jgi:hypothetical protein
MNFPAPPWLERGTDQVNAALTLLDASPASARRECLLPGNLGGDVVRLLVADLRQYWCSAVLATRGWRLLYLSIAVVP